MPELEDQLSFDDITVANALGVPDETPTAPENPQPEQPVEPEGATEVADEVEETQEPEETEEATPTEEPKVEGLKEVRAAYDRVAAREKTLVDELKTVNTVFEELGADAQTVADVVKEYGGIEQLKIGTQIYKLVTGGNSDMEQVLRQANEIIPETTEALVLYIAETVEKDLLDSYQERVFGKKLNDEQIAAVRDFVDFGATSQSKIPEELLKDEFGDWLPEKTRASVTAMWERNQASERKFAELSRKVDTQLNDMGNNQATQARDQYMAQAFNSVVDIANKLNIGNQEDQSQVQADYSVLETLTFKFFSMNPAADKALQQAIDTLGKPDAASKAKHIDATRQVTKYAKLAAERAATYLTPRAAKAAKAAESSALPRGEIVKSGVKPTGSKQSPRPADDWSDLTVNTLKLSGNRRGRR